MHKSCLFLVVFSIACGDDSSADAGGFDAATDTTVADVSSADMVAVDVPVTPDAAERCTPGESRTVPCERCGSAPQNCDSTGLWETPGECFDQGVCEAAEVEEEALAMCATRRRLCLDTCEWSDWGDGEEPSGECNAGDERPVECPPTESAVQTCTESCEWGAIPECRSACSDVLRSSPEEARELCVPASPFIRGDEVSRFDDAASFATVDVSSFFIDAYPVTYSRYIPCVDAGVCSGDLADSSPDLRDPDNADLLLVGVSRVDAWRFCRWDGDRRLPTQNEWEKAARGEAPRQVDFVWETEPTCEQLPTAACPNSWGATRQRPRYDTYAWSASYYGVRAMSGGVIEPTVDLVDVGSAADGLGTPSPLSPGYEGANRGAPLYNSFRPPAQMHLVRRGAVLTGGPDYPAEGGIRCVRSDVGAERSWESTLPTLSTLGEL